MACIEADDYNARHDHGASHPEPVIFKIVEQFFRPLSQCIAGPGYPDPPDRGGNQIQQGKTQIIDISHTQCKGGYGAQAKQTPVTQNNEYVVSFK